jgi:hypothetical protein
MRFFLHGLDDRLTPPGMRVLLSGNHTHRVSIGFAIGERHLPRRGAEFDGLHDAPASIRRASRFNA